VTSYHSRQAQAVLKAIRKEFDANPDTLSHDDVNSNVAIAQVYATLSLAESIEMLAKAVGRR
jgi:hypothetical protein